MMRREWCPENEKQSWTNTLNPGENGGGGFLPFRSPQDNLIRKETPMPSEADVTCPLHQGFKERIEQAETCLLEIKENALKSSRMAVWTLISVLIGMVSFFLTQVYFHVNNHDLSTTQIEQIISKTVEKVKK